MLLRRLRLLLCWLVNTTHSFDAWMSRNRTSLSVGQRYFLSKSLLLGSFVQPSRLPGFFNNVIGLVDPQQLIPPRFCDGAQLEERLDEEPETFFTLF
ncbi:hypothetical protein VZT92_016863 [Zoarces viviparus]|uniref:Secreted protein n=1 Tax=Zoarces viviparus TaxID=48416 RepID=A0AAW1EQY7_ZOAVI